MTGAALTLELQDGIAIVTIDLPNEPVNKFSAAVIGDVVIGSVAG